MLSYIRTIYVYSIYSVQVIENIFILFGVTYLRDVSKIVYSSKLFQRDRVKRFLSLFSWSKHSKWVSALVNDVNPCFRVLNILLLGVNVHQVLNFAKLFL